MTLSSNEKYEFARGTLEAIRIAANNTSEPTTTDQMFMASRILGAMASNALAILDKAEKK